MHEIYLQFCLNFDRFWWIFGLFMKGYPYEKTSILMNFCTFRKGVTLWKNVDLMDFQLFVKGYSYRYEKNSDICNFLVIFTIYTLLLALKSQQTVLWLNGHQFWEVNFWWLFGHFYHLYVLFGYKIETNGRMAKLTPVLRNLFLMTFWSILPFIRSFWLFFCQNTL